MADTIEKIYCTDGRDNDLAAIIVAGSLFLVAAKIAAKSLTLNWEDFI